MFLVTGGAGFIGSNLVAALVAQGREVVICDRLRSGDKWKNIAKHAVADIVSPDDLPSWLAARKGQIETIFHMGAISATTERDVDKIIENNLTLSRFLWDWCAYQQCRLVYASSAATYGDGALGFIDSNKIEDLVRLRPLNPYGWSKGLFDIQAIRMARAGHEPRSWAGLKFFNVYGPNEYHKASMRSVAVQMYESCRATSTIRLFRSANPHYADGGQMRDFVWVGDCVDMILWCAAAPAVKGIYNCGSGKARSFHDLARAVFAACGREGDVEWIDTPPEIARHYQYFTQADMTRARLAGFSASRMSLEDGITRYLQDYLMKDDIYV